MDIVGTPGDDTLVGGPDADHIEGLGGNDTLIGNGGADRLEGGSGDDILDGGGGDDRLNAGDAGGLDRFIGGSGNNAFLGNSSSVADYSAAPAAIHVRLVQGTASNGYGGTDLMSFVNNIVGSAFDDVIEGSGRINHFQGDDGDDLLDGRNGDDLLEGGNGNDILLGGEGWDTLIGGEGDDQLSSGGPKLSGGAGEDLLDGGGGDDVLSAFGGPATLLGGEGNDRLSGPATLVGGVGNDTYVIFSASGWTITELAGEGIDTVEAGGALSSFTLAANLENLSHFALNAFTGMGNELDNVMTGGDGTETFSGLGGDNVIDGGGGGDDTVSYATAASGVHVDLNEGGASDNGFGGVDILFNVENVIGTAQDDVIVGNAIANRLVGGAGSDYLVGLDGNDVLVGGAGAANQLQGGLGDDLYVVSVAGDTLIEFAGEGSDTVETTLLNYTLRANFENLTFTGLGAFTGIGNALGNVITGGAGNDRLEGLAGNNALFGGAGVDTASYATATSGVTVRLNIGTASNNGLGGADSISGVENVVGSAHDDLLVGDAQANRLEGGTGSDYLIGLAGNDVLVGGAGAANQLQGGVGDDLYIVSANDTIVEFAGEGIDTVETSINSYTLRDNIEHLTFTGAGAFTGIGNSLANIITGGAGDDLLRGLGGNNTLIGGAGTDTASYQGALGAVTVRLNTGTATANGFGGADSLSGIENAIGGNFDDLLIGNGAANRLEGGDGADYLIGLAGNDVLVGGAGAANQLQGGVGDDLYIVSANDSIIEAAGEGTDRVETVLTNYVLKANVENLTYTGTGDFYGAGNDGDNVITGGAGNDILRGGLGADTLIGGAGNDRYLFDSALGGGNVDTIAGFASGADRIWLEDSIFTALAPGGLPAGAFVAGTAALDADDRIIYDQATGALFYDADGNGAGAAIQFASLGAGTALTASDFAVI